MTRLEKIADRIRARPPQADFKDVETLLAAYGWHRTCQKGSHITFKKEGVYPITVPLIEGRRVARTYLDMICDRLGLDLE